jgi:Universal stress protein family
MLYDDDAGRAVAEHLRSRPDALLVMASTARGPIGELLFGSVSEHVLAHAPRPAVVVGPHVEVAECDGPPALLIDQADDQADDHHHVQGVIASWKEVLVAASRRWTGPGSHWHSRTRALVKRSRRPVLVVPVAPTPGLRGLTASAQPG